MTIEVKRRAMETVEKAHRWYDSWTRAYEVVAECLGVSPVTVRQWYSAYKRGKL